MDSESENPATSNVQLIATIDLTLATIGIMLDVFILSEGKSGQPYTLDGRVHEGNVFFFFAWGVVFVILLAQGLMAINLFTAVSKFPITPLKSIKKITSWQIWSVGLLILLVGGGIPTFTLSNYLDDFFGFTVTYLIVEILFRLVGITIVEFCRDTIKRETVFLRVLPRASSLLSTNTSKSGAGLPVPIYVNADVQSVSPSAPPAQV